MTATTVSAFSNDLSLPFEQEWIFTCHRSERNIFFLDVPVLDSLRQLEQGHSSFVGNRAPISTTWVTGSLVAWLSRTVSVCLPFFSKDRDVMSAISPSTPWCDNLFLLSWEVWIFLLDNFKWNLFCSCDEFRFSFNIGS